MCDTAVDVKSLLSLLSKSEGSTTGASTHARWHNAPLHEICSKATMVLMKDAFEKAYRNKMFPHEFRNLLRTLLSVEYDDDEYNILFIKVTFLSYL